MTINCKGKLIDLSTPKVMGIINATPDSFYTGSRVKETNAIVEKVGKMLDEGASFIDIGGYSSRPGASEVSVSEETDRVLGPIEAIVKNFPNCLISIDTFRAKVAREALVAGAAIVNDISAGHLDSEMIPTVAQFRAPYIMMHMKGTPQTMKSMTEYDDILKEVTFYFSECLKKVRAHNIVDVIIDPGFGFAKTIEQNFKLLQSMEFLNIFGLPVLAGVSRKSMIYKTLNTNAENALNGTTVLNTVALSKGAKILRVHDVKEAVECVTLFKSMNS